jgi:hypothetical protein
MLDRVGRGADKVSRGADAVEHASAALEDETLNRALPKLYGAIDDLSRSSHALNQVLFDIHAHPQSLIFGRAAPRLVLATGFILRHKGR